MLADVNGLVPERVEQKQQRESMGYFLAKVKKT